MCVARIFKIAAVRSAAAGGQDLRPGAAGATAARRIQTGTGSKEPVSMDREKDGQAGCSIHH